MSGQEMYAPFLIFMGRLPKWLKYFLDTGAKLHEGSGLYLWPDGRINRDVIYKSGTYPIVRDWDGKGWLLHRLMAECFIPNPENKPVVNHKDGDKGNYRLDNLEWATHQENSIHAWATGLSKHTPPKKFTKRQIIYIRSPEVNLLKLAKKYKVSYQIVYNIHYLKTYKNIK